MRLLCLLGLGACGQPDAPAARAPAARADIVLILIDTLRPDFVELLSETHASAPFLCELAERAVVFRQAFSTSSWTAPATASVFTGLYPPHHGVIKGFFAPTRRAAREAHKGGDGPPSAVELKALPRSWQTLPERMRAAGYQTFGVASNVNIGSELGFERGFDFFASDRQASIESLAATLLGWRKELDPRRPHFFYLHLNDVHDPYVGRAPWYVPGAEGVADDVARYKSEIRYVDEGLRALHAEMGWGPETARFVLSDHGEEFLEHGFIGHGFSLHGEVNRVLMILSPPGWEGGQRIVEHNVSLIDVLPTLLELAGSADASGLAGRSLLPLARGEAEAGDVFALRTLFAHRKSRRELWAAIRGPWKLIENERSGKSMLFELRSDPLEREDRLQDSGEVAAGLRRELDGFRRSAVPIEDATVEVGIDQELLEHLIDLGYTDREEDD